MNKQHLTWDEFCGMDDKDAFNEINRLVNEVARVKAESLRVVPCGEPCEYREVCEDWSRFYSYGDLIFTPMGPQFIESVIGRVKSKAMPLTAIVLPVRLVAWEEEG